MIILHEFEAPYAGIPTFLKFPHVKDIESLRNVDVAIAGVPLDETTTHRSGAKLAPRAIREASTSFSGYSRRSKVDLTNSNLTIVDVGDVPVIPGNTEKSHNATYTVVKHLITKNITPVLIGGDHSITYPAIKAHKIYNKKIGVIWLDSHLDFDMDYPPGQRYSHSCSLRRTSELSFVDSKNIVVVGYNGYGSHPEHEKEVDEAGIRVFSIDDIRALGVEKIAQESMEIVTKNTKGVYLSVDIDVLDPAFAPGTGLLEPGGLTTWELFKMLGILGKQIIALDLVEVAPPYDSGGITASNAAIIIIEALASRMRYLMTTGMK